MYGVFSSINGITFVKLPYGEYMKLFAVLKNIFKEFSVYNVPIAFMLSVPAIYFACCTLPALLLLQCIPDTTLPVMLKPGQCKCMYIYILQVLCER